MGKVEALYNKKRIFDELFKSIQIVIETKDTFDYPDKYNLCYLVNIESRIDIIREDVIAIVTSVSGEIKEKIERFFRSAIPPQIINYKCSIPILRIDAIDLLFSDDWNFLYLELLKETVKEEITTVEVLNDENKLIDYEFRIKNIFLY